MKKLLVIILVILVGCSKQAYPKFDYNNSENPYKNAFKDQVFFACLRKATTILKYLD